MSVVGNFFCQRFKFGGFCRLFFAHLGFSPKLKKVQYRTGNCGSVLGTGADSPGVGHGGDQQPEQGAAQVLPRPGPGHHHGLRLCPPLLAGGAHHLPAVQGGEQSSKLIRSSVMELKLAPAPLFFLFWLRLQCQFNFQPDNAILKCTRTVVA